ncbi:MAG: glutamine-hydrolyzing carbamoyl-phosphate synthase small subunit [Actinomycetota bacterium]|nr:glutamine-hydrolyzing carbamoyl-phosphate synthase small subunit [Actinomycetota bacterium]
MPDDPAPTEAHLVLADGSVFEGEAAGWRAPRGITTGEVVFNTVLAGYQEVLTDPSYAGQIVTFTYPHIGNYGVNDGDHESARPRCRGMIVRDLTARPSSWRSAGDLEGWLIDHEVPALVGIDTRRLTRRLRDHGAMPAAFGTAPLDELEAAAATAVGTDGLDLVRDVTCTEPYTVPYAGDGEARHHVVAYDFGIKTSILRQLARIARVTVVPASTPAADALALGPDGVFLSNGPGDPEPLTYAIEATRGLLGQVPVFGICLGHQILGQALGAETYKLRFGHHGGNQPIRRVDTGTVEITSQNHNYAVAAESIEGAEISHVNLNDGVVGGIRVPSLAAFGVQYHPEAGPGPHDARYLFEQFAELMASRTAVSA